MQMQGSNLISSPSNFKAPARPVEICSAPDVQNGRKKNLPQKHSKNKLRPDFMGGAT